MNLLFRTWLGRAALALVCLEFAFTSVTAEVERWVPFTPPADSFSGSAFDLRRLNEDYAGENGWIIAREGRFFHRGNDQPVRFWAVNGPPSNIKEPAELRRVARILAERGVNLVRIHGAVFDKDGEVDPKKVQHVIDIVEAMKTEGIYTHASIYFPLWFSPKADLPWLGGYDGKKHPFAALMFNKEFQAKYRSWWKALLHTPGERSGRKLIDEPALMGAEIQNEDSFFFWTFSEANIPNEQLRSLEEQFAVWLIRKYSSLDEAFAKWDGVKLARDAPEDGRVAFRGLWNIGNERTIRDQDTAAFLLEMQLSFYNDSIEFLRKLGFKGLVCASNWATASPEFLGPLEKLSYTAGDFIDRHGYFSCLHEGENSEWSIREGHLYADRSALRFEGPKPGTPRVFVHPAMDPHYNGKPSMISETTWTRPNRYRSEAPLYLASYGALQDSDAIVHFAFDGADWKVKPNFWMQPWTLASPAMMGQFPAAALIYRTGLVEPGAVVAKVALNKNDLLALKGTPLPQDANLDELRLKDVPSTGEIMPGQRLDPLLHYAGRTEVRFTDEPSKTELNLSGAKLDHISKTVMSSNGHLQIDYGNGILRINAPKAQGVSGNLAAAGEVKLDHAIVRSSLDLAHIVIVSLDDRPVDVSSTLLLQVMSEERNSGWKTEPATSGAQRIVSIGRDPWEFRALTGFVKLTRPDASRMKVTALDLNGVPNEPHGMAHQIALRPDTLYYLIEKVKE